MTHLRMLLASHLTHIQATLNTTLTQMLQTLPSVWEQDDSSTTIASAAQIYAMLSTIGAMQELVPTLSAQLKRSLEIISGTRVDFRILFEILISANNRKVQQEARADDVYSRIYSGLHTSDWKKIQDGKNGKE